METIPEIIFRSGFEVDLFDALSESGVVKVHGTVNAQLLDSLNDEFDRIVGSELPGVRDLGVEVGSAKDVERLQLVDGILGNTTQYFTQDWMQQLSDLYWGESRVLNDHVFVSHEVDGTKHLAQSLHFDVQETLKFFLYLNDVNSENGAFSCVPGSQGLTKQRRIEAGCNLSYENRDESRNHPFTEDDIIPVEGSAGTLIVFTTEVWHRAGLVKGGERRVMRGHTREKRPVECRTLYQRIKRQFFGAR